MPLCIMLVRMGDELDLGLEGLAVDVLRVKHPLPACERMRITRPLVVVVGSGIPEKDLERLALVARETGCEILECDAFVSHAAVKSALRRAVARAIARRTSEGNGTASGD
jgi:hypothetical protein